MIVVFAIFALFLALLGVTTFQTAFGVIGAFVVLSLAIGIGVPLVLTLIARARGLFLMTLALLHS
jgi:hypothetical protein